MRPAARNFDAVVIGGSAGSLEVLRLLLPVVRPGMPPIVIVVHVPPSNPDLLVHALAPHCSVPVQHAEDKEPIERSRVYVAPPAYHLLVETGRSFALSIDEPVNFSRPAIDVLFESASRVYSKRLLAILLSGANDDGARGVKQIQDAGGVVIVQSPDSASSTAMPASAIKLCTPDYVVPPKGIAALLNLLLGSAELPGLG